MSLCAAVKWKVSLLLLWYDPLDYCISSPSASEHVQEPVFPAPSYECIGQRRGSSCESRVSSSPLHSQFCERIDRQRTGTRQHCIMKTFIFWKWEKKCVNDHKSTLIVAVHTVDAAVYFLQNGYSTHYAFRRTPQININFIWHQNWSIDI